ncbi:YkvA family protein [Xanthobacter sediminis]
MTTSSNTAQLSALEWRVLNGADGAGATRDEARVRNGFWKKLKRQATYVPFAEEATAAYFAAFDRATPMKVRATLLAALAYFVLPVDAVPDVFPVLGFTDDAAVLMTALRLLSDHVKPHHHLAARDALDDMRRPD